jgi:hypothetical protein
VVCAVTASPGAGTTVTSSSGQDPQRREQALAQGPILGLERVEEGWKDREEMGADRRMKYGLVRGAWRIGGCAAQTREQTL